MPKKLTWKQEWRKHDAEKKRLIVYCILFLVGISIFMMFGFPLGKELDFYQYHVWECEQAHAEGKTFSLFSGNRLNPVESHIKNWWHVHPTENASLVVPHGCVGVKQRMWVFGIYGIWYTDTNIALENIGDLADYGFLQHPEETEID